MNGQKISRALLGLALATILPCAAQDLPHFVLGPPNRSKEAKGFRDLCQFPEQWSATRAVTNQLLCSGPVFAQCTDDELKTWFAQMKAAHIELQLEVGAVKEWGQTGDKTFAKVQPIFQRILNLGGPLTSIAMDEPLSCTRRMIKKPDDFAATETTHFIALMQQNFPDIRIIEIEPYPSIPAADHKVWIDLLQKKLADANLKPLLAYRLDVDWLAMNIRNVGSWKEVKQIEDDCHAAKLPFSLIYWAAGYGLWQKRGIADDSTWYVGTMTMGYAYAAIGGKPDQYVIESWVGAPATIVPETGDFTFTRTALDFYNKFIKTAPALTP